jgi:hypothetical protein
MRFLLIGGRRIDHTWLIVSGTASGSGFSLTIGLIRRFNSSSR